MAGDTVTVICGAPWTTVMVALAEAFESASDVAVSVMGDELGTFGGAV